MKRPKKIKHDQVIQVGSGGIFTRQYTLNLPETIEEEIEESESEAYDTIIEGRTSGATCLHRHTRDPPKPGWPSR